MMTRVLQYCVMRASFLQDHADLGEAFEKSCPTNVETIDEFDGDLMMLGRYLLGRPSSALRCDKQRVSVAHGFGADCATHKSTTIMVQRLWRHPKKTTSNLQTSIGLHVRECEFYVLVHGAAHKIGLQTYMRCRNRLRSRRCLRQHQ